MNRWEDEEHTRHNDDLLDFSILLSPNLLFDILHSTFVFLEGNITRIACALVPKVPSPDVHRDELKRVKYESRSVIEGGNPDRWNIVLRRFEHPR